MALASYGRIESYMVRESAVPLDAWPEHTRLIVRRERPHPALRSPVGTAAG